MAKYPPSVSLLSNAVFAIEKSQSASLRGSVSTALCICSKLREPLAKLAGFRGYCSLLSRALALARLDNPTLLLLALKLDGSFEPWSEGDNELVQAESDEAGLVLVTHLLGLLVTFIGETLTKGLLDDIWSFDSINEMHDTVEDKHRD